MSLHGSPRVAFEYHGDRGDSETPAGWLPIAGRTMAISGSTQSGLAIIGYSLDANHAAAGAGEVVLESPNIIVEAKHHYRFDIATRDLGGSVYDLEFGVQSLVVAQPAAYSVISVVLLAANAQARVQWISRGAGNYRPFCTDLVVTKVNP